MITECVLLGELSLQWNLFKLWAVCVEQVVVFIHLPFLLRSSLSVLQLTSLKLKSHITHYH